VPQTSNNSLIFSQTLHTTKSSVFSTQDVEQNENVGCTLPSWA